MPAIQGAMLMKPRPSEIIRPQSGVGGTTPRPRKDRPEASRMAIDTRMPAWIRMGETMLGSTWRSTISRSGTPMRRAASMKGRAFTCSTSARTVRANGPTKDRASARITLFIPRPSTAMKAMAMMSSGKASRPSTTRISTHSVRPPRRPASKPTATPTSRPSATEAKPIHRAERAP